MAFTYDVTTSRGRIRLLCRDTAAASAVFTDDEIDAFLDLANTDVLLAASMACSDLAARGVKTFTGITLGAFSIDSSATDGWQALAGHYKTLAYERSGGVTAEMDWDEFAAAEHLDNWAYRGDEQPTD